MIARTPVQLSETVATFDAVAHFLWHAIEDAEQGLAVRGLPVPLALAAVPLQMTRDILGAVLSLIESGSLILWQVESDDGLTSFELGLPGIN